MECSTRPSNVRVCQFRHFRISSAPMTGVPPTVSIIAQRGRLVKGEGEILSGIRDKSPGKTCGSGGGEAAAPEGGRGCTGGGNLV